MHSKQILDYFAVSESSIFTVFSNVTVAQIIKTPEVFKAYLPTYPTYRAPLDPLLILNMPSV